jgi:hypothetical protein
MAEWRVTTTVYFKDGRVHRIDRTATSSNPLVMLDSLGDSDQEYERLEALSDEQHKMESEMFNPDKVERVVVEHRHAHGGPF